MTLAYTASFGDNSLLEVSFKSVPINANQVYTTLVGTDASSVDSVHLPGGGTFPPDIVEVREHVIFEIYLPLITKAS